MAEKKQSGPAKKKPTSKKYKQYQIAGSDLKRKNKFCPKCGVGVFMAAHKDRLTCGKCGYTEFTKK
jgi:small subunit ribosomal protein S27Ae